MAEPLQIMDGLFAALRVSRLAQEPLQAPGGASTKSLYMILPPAKDLADGIGFIISSGLVNMPHGQSYWYLEKFKDAHEYYTSKQS